MSFPLFPFAAGDFPNNRLQLIYFHGLPDQFLMLHFDELPRLFHRQDGVSRKLFDGLRHRYFFLVLVTGFFFFPVALAFLGIWPSHFDILRRHLLLSIHSVEFLLGWRWRHRLKLIELVLAHGRWR